MAKRIDEATKPLGRTDNAPPPGSGPWIDAHITRALRDTYKKLDAFSRRDEPQYEDQHVRSSARAARDVQAILHALVRTFEGAPVELRKRWAKKARLALKEAGRNLDDVYGAARLHARYVAALIDSKEIPAPTDDADSCKRAAAIVYAKLFGKFSPIRVHLMDRWRPIFSPAEPTDKDDYDRDPIGVRTSDENKLGVVLRLRVKWTGERVVITALRIAGYKKPDNLFRD